MKRATINKSSAPSINRYLLLKRRIFTGIGIAIFLLLILSPLSFLLFGKIRRLPFISQARASASPIQHVIFIIKENHSFDDYFGAFPGVNGTTTGKVRISGVDYTIPLNPLQDIPQQDWGHGWGNAHTAYDNGAMDQFNQNPCNTAPYQCYEEAKQSDIPN